MTNAPTLPGATFQRYYAAIRPENGEEVCYVYDGATWTRTDEPACRKVIFGARQELTGEAPPSPL